MTVRRRLPHQWKGRSIGAPPRTRPPPPPTHRTHAPKPSRPFSTPRLSRGHPHAPPPLGRTAQQCSARDPRSGCQTPPAAGWQAASHSPDAHRWPAKRGGLRRGNVAEAESAHTTQRGRGGAGRGAFMRESEADYRNGARGPERAAGASACGDGTSPHDRRESSPRATGSLMQGPACKCILLPLTRVKLPPAPLHCTQPLPTPLPAPPHTHILSHPALSPHPTTHPPTSATRTALARLTAVFCMSPRMSASLIHTSLESIVAGHAPPTGRPGATARARAGEREEMGGGGETATRAAPHPLSGAPLVAVAPVTQVLRRVPHRESAAPATRRRLPPARAERREMRGGEGWTTGSG